MLGLSVVRPLSKLSGTLTGRSSMSRRNFTSNPFPASSLLYNKYEWCLDKATETGIDLSIAYTPWLPVDLMQNTIIAFEHVLPFGSWPLAIAVTAVFARLLLFPMQLWSMRKSQSSQSVMKDMESINKRLKQASGKSDSKQLMKLQEKYNALVNEHGRFFAVKGIVGSLLPIPLFMTSFTTIRGLAEHPHLLPSFALHDPLWLHSLALPDPYYILPVLSAGLFLTNLELTGRLDSAAGSSAADVRKSMLGNWGQQFGNVLTDDFMANIKKYGLRSVIVSSLYFTTGFPAACFFFFIPNTILAITQNRLLRKDAVKLWLGLQPRATSASTTSTPSPVGLLPPPTAHLTKLEDFLKIRRAEEKLRHSTQALSHTIARKTVKLANKPTSFAPLHAREQPATVKAVLRQMRQTLAVQEPRRD